MIKYICVFWLVLRFLLVARKDNLTSFSTGLTGRSKNLDPIGNPTGFHLWVRASSTELFRLGFDSGRVKPNTIKIGIHSFLRDVQQTNGQCEASAVCSLRRGSLTRRLKGAFTVSWPRKLGE